MACSAFDLKGPYCRTERGEAHLERTPRPRGRASCEGCEAMPRVVRNWAALVYRVRMSDQGLWNRPLLRHVIEPGSGRFSVCVTWVCAKPRVAGPPCGVSVLE
jgi:hypothetical protein